MQDNIDLESKIASESIVPCQKVALTNLTTTEEQLEKQTLARSGWL